MRTRGWGFVALAIAAACGSDAHDAASHGQAPPQPPPPQPPPVVVDAAVAQAIDAAPPPRVSIDVATLPDLGSGGSGSAVELYAVDADGDRVLAAVAAAPLLVVAAKDPVRLTGKLAAPSRAAATAAIAGRLGIAIAPVTLRGSGDMTFAFGRATQHDLLMLIGDYLKKPIVVGYGDPLPDVDVVLDHGSPDGLLAALAALDHRDVVRTAGAIYVLDHGVTLPPLPAHATGVVTIDSRNAPETALLGALRALHVADVGNCGTNPISLRLVDAPAAEALRAIVAVGVGGLGSGSGGCAWQVEHRQHVYGMSLDATVFAGSAAMAVLQIDQRWELTDAASLKIERTSVTGDDAESAWTHTTRRS